MGRGRTVAGLAALVLVAPVAGFLISSQIPHIPIIDELWGIKPPNPAASASAPKPEEELEPIVLTAAEGRCVEPEQRETYTVKTGDTLWGIAEATLRQGEDIGEWINYLREANGITDPRLLQIGEKIVTRNNDLIHKLYVPESALAYLQLRERQPLSVQVSQEGMLCGTHIKIFSTNISPPNFKFEGETFKWTPLDLQGGKYYVTFVANDGAFDAKAEIVISVKTRAYELATDGNPRIKYKIVPWNDGLSHVLTLDGETGYLLNAYRRVDIAEIVSAQKLAANREVAFSILHQRVGGRTISNGSDLAYALDHLLRVLQTEKWRGTAPFTSPEEINGNRTTYWLPILTEEVQLAAVK